MCVAVAIHVHAIAAQACTNHAPTLAPCGSLAPVVIALAPAGSLQGGTPPVLSCPDDLTSRSMHPLGLVLEHPGPETSPPPRS